MSKEPSAKDKGVERSFASLQMSKEPSAEDKGVERSFASLQISIKKKSDL
jgi:hypothetical protein